MVVDLAICLAAIGFSSASLASLVLDQWYLRRNEERLEGRLDERLLVVGGDEDDSLSTWIMIKWDALTTHSAFVTDHNFTSTAISSSSSSSNLEDDVFVIESTPYIRHPITQLNIVQSVEGENEDDFSVTIGDLSDEDFEEEELDDSDSTNTEIKNGKSQTEPKSESPISL
ncbi:uncharacterized protein LOC134854460 [Symsagittifera roscoffensis]|uniref:uncharacterized protein LOC134854460 n=1 Tax=Symsagittifera roscoffensis TaxID=84072 RepID=UPI00307BC200